MYPRKSKIFQAWAKAMVDGATVDKPSYPGTSKSYKGRAKPQKQQRRRRRKRRHAKKES